jgi:hypothetical protein
MRISVCSLIVPTLLLLPATAACDAGQSPRVALHWLWNERETDSAYTVDAARRASMTRERGYADMGVVAYVDSRPGRSGRPLKCFYFPAPHTNTFCSISRIEQKTIRDLGYRYTSDEGYLEIEKTEGAVALFRLSRAYGNGDDTEHRFVVSEDELRRLRKDGWTFDGVKGYVFTEP